MYFLIVSGMSGAGKSRAVATLEDLGYYCVDNLPISLIPRFAEICLAATERYERVALVTDVRAGGDFQQLFDSLDSIKSMGCDYRIHIQKVAEFYLFFRSPFFQSSHNRVHQEPLPRIVQEIGALLHLFVYHKNSPFCFICNCIYSSMVI